MNILIDIGHPAHVHYFKNFAWIMQKQGHTVFFTTIEKEFEPYLLKTYGFHYKKLGNHKKTLPGKIFGLIIYNLRLLSYSLKVRPGIFLGAGSISASHVAFILRKPFIQLEDTGNMEQIRLYRLFAKAILTPDVLLKDLGSKQIRYRGYQELCYLLPAFFKPNPHIFDYLKVPAGTRYAIVRFVSWDATHDVRQKGLSLERKREIISFLAGRMHVFISSEGHLPEEFEPMRISIPPEMMHDALAFADIFVGEGATMASEAGILGTPSIYINSLKACNNIDQETYGTVFNFSNDTDVIGKIAQILHTPDYKKAWKEKSGILLSHKINVTEMLVWFVENFPESSKILQNDPNYQMRF